MVVSSSFRRRVASVGDLLRDHQGAIRRIQWVIVVVYVALLTIPAAMPLPDSSASVFNNLTIAAQFAFWGIWWPFVLVSIPLFGRAWCGLFCPEGALTEWASRHGRGGAIPRWMRWGGWPFVAFSLTTIYGQLVSVYQYPWAAAAVLGGSTIAAIVVGWLYGRNKRVWCKTLCPVNGVFNLLAKLAPWHYGVDAAAWRAPVWRTQSVNCAPLLPLRTMQGAGECHMCGRCSDYRGAITLSPRSPEAEIVEIDLLYLDFVVGSIQRNIACSENFRRRVAADAPQHHLDSCHQLTRTERFGDVIIRADLQPDEFVGFFHACCEHDDGHIALAPNGLA